MGSDGEVQGTTRILQGVEAQSRLNEIGAPASLIAKAVLAADGEARRYGYLDPPIMKGIARWACTIQRLRRDLVPQGWTFSNPQNLPLTIAPDGDIRIIVTTGSKETADPSLVPSTKYKRGPQTARTVGRSDTDDPGLFSLADLGVEEAVTEEVVTSEHQTYFLLYVVNETEKTIRVELSRAAKVEPQGEVNDWIERIIIGKISLPAAGEKVV